MGHRVSKLLPAAALMLALAAGSAWAQSNTTSGVTGVVSNESGTNLAGATVTIEGPALIGGAHPTKTDRAGRYRFPEVPPGPYTLTASLAGFQTVRREGVTLELGKTAEVSITLRLETVSETVEVLGEAPAIDVTSSTAPTNLNNDYLQNLPTSRFQPDVLNLAPGINMSAAYGGAESSANAYQIDGVDVSDPEGGTPWAFFNYNLIKEVQLVGLGAPAKYGQFTGVVFNSITQSGGNQIKGLVETLFTNHSLTSNNSDIPGLNPTIKQASDSTIQFGGPLIKDKLWYFLSTQYLTQDTSNGGPIRTEKDPRVFTKGTWQVNSSSSIEAWGEWDRYDIVGRGGNAQTPLEATVQEKAPEVVLNFSEHSVLTENTIFNIAVAGYTGYYYLNPQSGFDIPGHLDAQTGLYSQNSIYFFKANRDRAQLNASLSHYTSNFLHGDHDFKFGMEVERSTVRNRYGYTTGVWLYDNYGTAPDPGTNSGAYVPYSLGYYGNSYDVHAENRRLSTYAQDTWRVNSRLTLNPGLRVDFDRGQVSSGKEVFSTNSIAPRIGFAWDVAGDGKTLVKGHYGRYYEGLFAAYYYWVDPNAFQGGEIRRIFPSGFSDLVTETAGGRYAIDPNIKQPFLDQFILGVDRELIPGITLSGTLVYRKNKDLIETISRDGQFVPVTGFVGVLDANGNRVSTGQKVTLYDYLNPGTDTLIATNPNGLERKYQGAILTVTRRLKDNWQMLASYVYSKTTGNIDNLDGFNSAYGGNNPGKFLDTPNSLVNAQGRLTHDQTNQFKLQGSYTFPRLHLTFGGNYTYFTGDTWTPRTSCLLVDDGNGNLVCHSFPQGTVRFFAEPRGSLRLPSFNEIDLRAEWGLPIARGEASLILDIFNVTNQGVATGVEDRIGLASYGQPQTLTTPRNYRLGLRYRF